MGVGGASRVCADTMVKRVGLIESRERPSSSCQAHATAARNHLLVVVVQTRPRPATGQQLLANLLQVERVKEWLVAAENGKHVRKAFKMPCGICQDSPVQ